MVVVAELEVVADVVDDNDDDDVVVVVVVLLAVPVVVETPLTEALGHVDGLATVVVVAGVVAVAGAATGLTSQRFG